MRQQSVRSSIHKHCSTHIQTTEKKMKIKSEKKKISKESFDIAKRERIFMIFSIFKCSGLILTNVDNSISNRTHHSNHFTFSFSSFVLFYILFFFIGIETNETESANQWFLVVGWLVMMKKLNVLLLFNVTI